MLNVGGKSIFYCLIIYLQYVGATYGITLCQAKSDTNKLMITLTKENLTVTDCNYVQKSLEYFKKTDNMSQLITSTVIAYAMILILS
jgi:hypothetical protein